jgi:hypothetical protein
LQASLDRSEWSQAYRELVSAAKLGIIGTIRDYHKEEEELTDEALDAFRELPNVFLKSHMEGGWIVVVVVDGERKTTRRGGCDKKNLKRNGNVGDRRVRLLAIRGLALVEADWDAAGLAPSLSLP